LHTCSVFFINPLFCPKYWFHDPRWPSAGALAERGGNVIVRYLFNFKSRTCSRRKRSRSMNSNRPRPARRATGNKGRARRCSPSVPCVPSPASPASPSLSLPRCSPGVPQGENQQGACTAQCSAAPGPCQSGLVALVAVAWWPPLGAGRVTSSAGLWLGRVKSAAAGGAEAVQESAGAWHGMESLPWESVCVRRARRCRPGVP
jgi:hypothetical protein